MDEIKVNVQDVFFSIDYFFTVNLTYDNIQKNLLYTKLFCSFDTENKNKKRKSKKKKNLYAKSDKIRETQSQISSQTDTNSQNLANLIKEFNLYVTPTQGFVIFDIFSILIVISQSKSLQEKFFILLQNKFEINRDVVIKSIVCFKSSVVFQLFQKFYKSKKIVSFDNLFGSLFAIYEENPFLKKRIHATNLVFFGDLNIILIQRVSTILRKNTLVLIIPNEKSYLACTADWHLLKIDKE